ncbi:hypothetical protein K491DRAFT_587677 [Lophiostoma macrostomum CBS 122681]|uniref:ARM repeat-containing protein n=1 Tax=Lophiostoma macrostomum CBS 122681 TaxID=1314788 RepID=A0A6A6TMV8_9PLEO|nr:hypothetical protein K491DRAFT_587677 [Lophiostoma macrostomum CBS 122681]
MSADDNTLQSYHSEDLDINQFAQEPAPGYDGGDLKKWLSNIESALERGDQKRLVGAETTFKMLGTAVGQSKSWQVPLRASGVLAHASRHVSSSKVSLALRRQYLRVIGNCVADNDDNREAAVRDLNQLIACMQQDELTTTTLAVIFNLCNDFEPAQVEAAKLRLDSTIVGRLVANQIPEEAFDYAAELITWTTEKLSPAQIQDATSIATCDHILDIILQHDEDHYHEYVAVCTYYLQDPEFQKSIGTSDRMVKLLNLARDYESRLEPEERRAVFEVLATQQDPQKGPSDDHTILLLAQLINAISAISASDAFAQSLDIRSPHAESITTNLFNTPVAPSTVCDCMIVGNLATSDETSIYIVDVLHFDRNLNEILLMQEEPALLYAAAAGMRHLAFPEKNRSRLRDVTITCGRLLAKIHDPSVRGEAAALLGKLVSDNIQNTKSVIWDTISDSTVPVTQPGVVPPDRPTLLHIIVVQALAPSAPLPSPSMKNAMIELGRVIVTMLRYLAKRKPGDDADPVLAQMYETPLIARPIARLVRQRFYADARAEGLLGLGLMVQSKHGATCVMDELKADGGLLTAIKEMVTETEQKQDEQANAAALGRDHQNALVLMHGLLEKGVSLTSDF